MDICKACGLSPERRSQSAQVLAPWFGKKLPIRFCDPFALLITGRGLRRMQACNLLLLLHERANLGYGLQSLGQVLVKASMLCAD